MQAEEYERTELTITEFDSEDVITTSGGEPRRDPYEYRLFR